MALVICRVFLTLRMRRRRSSTFAMLLSRSRLFLLLVLFRTVGEEVCLVVLDGVGQALLDVVVERLLGGDVGEDGRVARLEVGIEAVLEGAQVLDFNVVEQAVDAGEEDGDLLLSGERLELRLLEQLGEALAAVELLLRDLVEVGAELREGGELAILREVELQGCADLLGRLDGSREAYARDREADVDGGTNARVEEVGLEEDLAVGDGDDVGRDVRGDVAGLGLDDRQRGERAAAELVGELWSCARADASGGRRRRRDRLRGLADGGGAARFRGSWRRAWRGRRR